MVFGIKTKVFQRLENGEATISSMGDLIVKRQTEIDERFKCSGAWTICDLCQQHERYH